VRPARQARRRAIRLLRIDPCRGAFTDERVGRLPGLLGEGDLLVLNDAATLPASLRVGELEVRLAGEQADGSWRAVLLGAGDFRTPTEHRAAPPALEVGAHLCFAPDLHAEVVAVSPVSPRLVTLGFARAGAALYAALYRHGRPVQYSHVPAPLALWDVQTRYAGRPWAMEAPSAGLPLDGDALLALRRRGVALATLTHAAGLSSTGDAGLDASLPWPERYEIPAATVEAVARARRVVAVGTTVVRALEGCVVTHGRLVAGAGVTDLKITPGFRPRLVSGLVTGLHEPGSSHLELLGAFVARPLLDAAYAHAEAHGYLGHELGDTNLVLCS
jgi:S-adenosylmethionine:tRNA ribosyltransferase-isomerase